jgi:hypothetical protein
MQMRLELPQKGIEICFASHVASRFITARIGQRSSRSDCRAFLQLP